MACKRPGFIERLAEAFASAFGLDVDKTDVVARAFAKDEDIEDDTDLDSDGGEP